MSDTLGLPVPVMEPEILRDDANRVAEIFDWGHPDHD